MAANQLRFGIIGTGAMGLEHIRNLRLVKKATVTAIADTSERMRAIARDLLDRCGMDAAVLRDYHDLLARDDVDAVLVATPNHTHIDVLRDVLVTDKHVLVEKPLCTTVRDCAEVAAMVAHHPGVFWVGMEYRYMPAVDRLIKEVDGGTVGDLRMLSIREHRFPFLIKVDNWNRFTANTGGTLVEKCCHFFDLMRRITGCNPLRVFATGGQAVNHLDEKYHGRTPDILDHAYVIVDFAASKTDATGNGGVRCLLDLCMFAEASKYQEEIAAVEAFAPGHGDHTEDTSLPNVIIGKRAQWVNSVAPPDPRTLPPLQFVHESVSQEILEAGFHHGATYFQLTAFVNAVNSGLEPTVGLADGVWAVAMGVAAHRSIAQHRPVRMDEVMGEYTRALAHAQTRSRRRTPPGNAKAKL